MTTSVRGGLCLLAVLVAASPATAAPAASSTRARAAGGSAVPPFSHALLDTVLARYVQSGSVDYGALSRDHEALDRYLLALATAHPADWPRNEQIAFWVNAYNANVLSGVLRRPGLHSVMDLLPGLPPFFKESRMIGGAIRSLDDIEGTVLAGFHEPRVHFVLNCASKSCPVLPARALRGATLEKDLESATRRFLTDPERNRIEPRRALQLSHVFDWHGADFREGGVSLQSWIAKHWPGRERFAPGLPLNFLPYDWALNGHW